MARQMEDPRVRFLRKVVVDGEHWIWIGGTSSETTSGRYGRFHLNGRLRTAQAASLEIFAGISTVGWDVDHLCRITLCVKPDHLERVTHAENVRRGRAGAFYREKTHCPQGHSYDEANTRWYRNMRYCITCIRARQRAAA